MSCNCSMWTGLVLTWNVWSVIVMDTCCIQTPLCRKEKEMLFYSSHKTIFFHISRSFSIIYLKMHLWIHLLILMLNVGIKINLWLLCDRYQPFWDHRASCPLRWHHGTSSQKHQHNTWFHREAQRKWRNRLLSAEIQFYVIDPYKRQRSLINIQHVHVVYLFTLSNKVKVIM